MKHRWRGARRLAIAVAAASAFSSTECNRVRPDALDAPNGEPRTRATDAALHAANDFIARPDVMTDDEPVNGGRRPFRT
jgi:hypothetical protein